MQQFITRLLHITTGILIIFNFILFSLSFAQENPVHINSELTHEANNVSIKTTLTIDSPWHINSHEPNTNFLIPTTISFEECPQIDIKNIKYPEPITKKLKTFSKELSLYTGIVTITAEGFVKEVTNPSCILTINYQACNDISCLKPQTKHIDLSSQITITEAPEPGIQGNEYNQKFQHLFLGGNYFLAFLLLFIAGLLLNLTPCVYPMVPITIGFFVKQAESRFSRLFFLGTAYALGICLTYSFLGFFAAVTGNMFGMLLQQKIVLIAIAFFIVLLALSMFGLFEIKIPIKLLPKEGKKGIVGSFFMGATLGLVAAPCVGPFILGLLAFVSHLGSRTLGFIIFFVFSLGLALPYLVLALFSGSIKSLPKSGEWLIWVKKFLGIILIAMALYIIQPILGGTLYIKALLLLLFISAIYLGFIDRTGNHLEFFKFIKRIIALVLIVFCFFSYRWQGIPQKVTWIRYQPGIIEESQKEKKPMIVDFYAEWCFPCKIMEETTFQDNHVVTELERFTKIKVDLTFDDNSVNQELAEKYALRGVPTYLFFDSSGAFLENKTISGAVEPDEFLTVLKEIP